MNAPDFLAPLRIPPAALESESAVVGALLLDNSAFDRISDRLKPEHFFSDDNRVVFAEIARQLGTGKPADVVTVAQALGALVSRWHSSTSWRSSCPARPTWRTTPAS
ncbi:DnaB-like helicase N-terminal domain-containing protein [Ottowia pentelensis]|uniref:DnaB-like helicase N-terminal domain-containing protein n=1 Tax=Ottowia pentelensis TaxID=511108 RepID=UPI0036309738